MADWEQQIAELRTDIKHVLKSQDVMKTDIKNLQKFSAMGAGGLKVLVIVGVILGIIAKWMGLFD